MRWQGATARAPATPDLPIPILGRCKSYFRLTNKTGRIQTIGLVAPSIVPIRYFFQTGKKGISQVLRSPIGLGLCFVHAEWTAGSPSWRIQKMWKTLPKVWRRDLIL